MIRVKEFAKLQKSESQDDNDGRPETNENDNKNCVKPTIDIEVISLSSNDDVPVQRAPSKQSKPRTPAKQKPKRLNNGATTPSKRAPKLPSAYNYRKISEYFAAAKKGMPSISEKLSNNIKTPRDIANNNGPATATVAKSEAVAKKPTESSATSNVKQCRADLRQAKVVLRRLSIEKPVDTVRKRKIQDDQSKMSEFIDYESSNDTYFKTYEQSTYHEPSSAGIPPDKQVKFDETNPHNSNDSSAFGGAIKPEIIECDVNTENGIVESIDNNSCEGSKQGDGTNDDSVDSKTNSNSNGTGSSTSNVSKPTKRNTKKSKRTAKTLMGNATKPATAKRTKPECPYYKIIDGTMLAVDAFRYGDIDGVEHYFLSHFHADHYIGLKKSFSHKLYVSKITGRLVVDLIKVNEQYINYLDINKPIIVDEIEVTALDANHCPGAVMFLFKLKTGRCILHTGDFRASPDMEEYPEFWNNDIDTIYLDTTYLSSKYDFFTQSDSITLTLQYCREFVKSCTSSSTKHLMICGAYKVGKEKVWLRIAQEFNYKVWIDDERHKVMRCIQNDEIDAVLTRHAKDANIHVLTLGSISYQFIVDYVSQFGESFSKVLAIRPSGWEKKAAKPNFANRISILGVQYSEHSSYNELERFVRFMRPKQVISTVPFSSQNVSRTPKVPDSWLNQKLEPKSQSYQRNIKDYMIKKKPDAKSNGVSAIPTTSTRKMIESNANTNSNIPPDVIESISISDDSSDYML